ncbi:hypothetical protein [Sphingobium sp. LMC3-1-1.1]|uniref:hypothetical protein n=1 Tax=unclassified Sphingobium TaxID=2611147 RepID=UPI0034419A89
MSLQPELAERIAAMAPLDVPDAYAESVAQWLDILADHILAFSGIELPDAVDPAPMFRA